MSRSRVPSRSPLRTPLGAHLGNIVHLFGCKLVQGLLRYLVHHRFCLSPSQSRPEGRASSPTERVQRVKKASQYPNGIKPL